MDIGPRIIFRFTEDVYITESVLWGLVVAVLLVVLALWSTRKMEMYPSKKQVVAEFIVQFIYNLTKNTMGPHNVKFAPYIGTIFPWILICNMLGLFGFRPATADVNTTFALSTITFFLVQYNSFKSMGFVGKIKHMCDPYPVLFPIKIIEMLSQPVSLGFRLFGNILGGVIVMELLAHALHGLAEHLHWSIPVFNAVIPLPANLFFDVFEPVVQAFIFTMLTMVFISLEIAVHGEEDH